MGQLRTANKRHKRAILASYARDRVAEAERAAPLAPAAEAVPS